VNSGEPGEPFSIESAFGKGRPALIVYLMAGYPDRQGSLEALFAAARAGADIIELGVPYADALADGPVIANAASVAMSAAPEGFGLAETIELAAEFISAQASRKARFVPVLLMTYFNPLLRMGYRRAALQMREAKVSGVIVPDMPVEMAQPWLREAGELSTVFMVAPTSTPERMRKAAEHSVGFVYAVSTTGVTGERDKLPADMGYMVSSMRAFTSLPIALGFGIATPEHVVQAARIADGVIVGSACVRRQHDPEALEAFVGELADALKTE